MGCSSSVVSKDISKPELMAPQAEEPITERPGQKAENNEFKPPETPDDNDLHARSVNEQLSRPPFPFKKGRTDSCMEDSRPQSRYGQALKIQNMPIVANSQHGKLPASFL